MRSSGPLAFIRFVPSILCLVSLTSGCGIEADEDFTQDETLRGEPSIEMPKLYSPFKSCLQDSSPVGGSAGYTHLIDPATATILIESPITGAQFRTIVEGASNGDVIYIDEGIEIDLTGETYVQIPIGVDLYSGRGIGNNQGALIRTDDYGDYNLNTGQWNDPSDIAEMRPILQAMGRNRISGIRVHGPTSYIADCARAQYKDGLLIDDAPSVEVDNCEFTKFGGAGISVTDSDTSNRFTTHHIHHNYLHRNRQPGLGYGVMIGSSAYATIEANIFEWNRHDVTATGGDNTSGYEAVCNTILGNSMSSNLDMHGGEDDDEITAPGGEFVYIHHNDIRDEGQGEKCGGSKANIIIRGKPRAQARIENNKFRNAKVFTLDDGNQSSAISWYELNDPGNVLVWNNLYGDDEYLGWYVRGTWDKNRTSNFIRLPSSNDDLFRNGGSQRVYSFGDFDGDGNTDIFKSEGGSWWTLPFDADQHGLGTQWTQLATSAFYPDDVQFGNFDGDDTTDILKADGVEWRVAYSGSSAWNLLATSGYVLADLQFGNFDNNGITDVFVANGVDWEIAYDGMSAWTPIASSGYLNADIHVDQFDASNHFDVFLPDGSTWQMSWDGSSNWTQVATSGVQMPDLYFGDFNGDGSADVFWSGTDWNVSDSASSSWKQANVANYPLANFPYGTMN